MNLSETDQPSPWFSAMADVLSAPAIGGSHRSSSVGQESGLRLRQAVAGGRTSSGSGRTQAQTLGVDAELRRHPQQGQTATVSSPTETGSKLLQPPFLNIASTTQRLSEDKPREAATPASSSSRSASVARRPPALALGRK